MTFLLLPIYNDFLINVNMPSRYDDIQCLTVTASSLDKDTSTVLVIPASSTGSAPDQGGRKSDERSDLFGPAAVVVVVPSLGRRLDVKCSSVFI